MTGKFTDYENFVYQLINAGLLIAGLAAVLVLASAESAGALIAVIVPVLAHFVFRKLLSKCSYEADEEKIVIFLGFFPFTYKYSEICSAEICTGVSHDRFNIYPYIQIKIYLKDDDTVTLNDFNVPSEVLTTPEKHKIFCDEHQFTALCSFITEHINNDIKCAKQNS